MPILNMVQRVAMALLMVVIAVPAFAATVIAQSASPTALSCTVSATPAALQQSSTPLEIASPAAELTKVTIGYTPVSIFAPLMVAKELGYFAEEGVDVELAPFPGGSDAVVLTASGDMDVAIAGAGPAFWNAMSQDLPITVIAPGHMEGDPVATPLMISASSCASGEITSIEDLRGKKVSVNARGATEYWLDQALRSGGLTIDDIQLEQLPFPDAVAALESGAIDAAMVGEPLATNAEQQGIAVRLAQSFDVQGVQPTLLFANDDFLANNAAAAEGVVTGYLRAMRTLTDGGFQDPAILAIIEQYTGVPADLIAASVKPVYPVDGVFNVESLMELQEFFRQRGLLEYNTNIDPEALLNRSFVDSALAELNPNSP